MSSVTSPQHYISASAASSWVYCQRRAWLDMHQPAKVQPDPFNQLLINLGMAHETKMLAKLSSQFSVKKAESVQHTYQLMQQNFPLIYQPRLLDEQERLIGHPDFLIRHENGEYQAADAKLSLNENKKAIQIQLGIYRRLLRTSLPVIVFLGDERTAWIGDEAEPLVEEYLIAMRLLKTQTELPHARYSHSKCKACPYFLYCQPEFERKQDISLLYGVHGMAANYLEQHGILTVSQLAEKSTESIPDIPYLKGRNRKHRATLQAQSIVHQKIFQLHPVTLPDGTWIHFDIEDNPLTVDRKRHVYLWGLLAPPYTKNEYEYIWTDNESHDYQGWIAFLNKMEAYRDRYSDMVVAHYSGHEKNTIKQYAERYAMENDATVKWLLGDNSPLFDLQKPILENLVLPLSGYGLKDICKHPDLVNFQWENEESGSQWSLVQFNRFQCEHDIQSQHKLKAAILTYNCDDVRATRHLELWLKERFLSEHCESSEES